MNVLYILYLYNTLILYIQYFINIKLSKSVKVVIVNGVTASNLNLSVSITCLLSQIKVKYTFHLNFHRNI